ncbi:MAG: hypothetical protein KME16_23765 [Scytolyngbya sp. HA4215-MV1]|jgi:hypothetical protein|nr:hypothetical protein [Scytolyngbya sp. HA4215-MV1]
MTALNLATRRRLKQLPQIPSVWEGDRHSMVAGMQASLEWSATEPADKEGECILWVDGSQGMVRAMDVVTSEAGHEAVVRVLLRAMEHPHSPAQPARPQKIVVRDREIQFFLRGVLQDLNITVEYVPDLPLIDEIFQSFQEGVNNRQPQLPPEYADQLKQTAYDIWKDAPWELLGDHEILAIELNRWDLGTVYACVMGMLGMEYGILLYRSLESLRRFRQQVLTNESMEQLEEAFLGQDCLFLSFEHTAEDEDEAIQLAELSITEIQPVFGSLHPLEGPRPFLYEEEAIALLVMLEAFHRFLRQHRTKLIGEDLPALSSRYRVPLPQAQTSQPTEKEPPVSIKIETLPDLAAELLELGHLGEDEDEQDLLPALRDDLVPKDSFLSLGVIPWATLTLLRQTTEYHQPAPTTEAGEGLPVILIQTSRPKAKTLVQELQNSSGLKAICFNPGEDPFGGKRYDLGLFQVGSGDLFLFGEFVEDDPVHVAARTKWEQRCKKTKGYCGLIVAKGLKGSTRGNPQLKDMVALFEARAITSEELGLGSLQLQMQVDWM